MFKNVPLYECFVDKTRIVVKFKRLQSDGAVYPLFLAGYEHQRGGMTPNVLNTWLGSRVTAVNRAGLKSALRRQGMTLHNMRVLDIVEYSLGLSLNDCFWVKREGTDYTWETVNFYTNRFSEVLGYRGINGTHTDATEHLRSPELSTTGNLLKCWRVIGDTRMMLKTGQRGTVEMSEVAMEKPAGEIARLFFDIPSVQYELVNWEDRLFCSCDLFTSEIDSYVTFAELRDYTQLHLDVNYTNLYQVLTRALPDWRQCMMDLNMLFVYDAVVGNEDRHYNNFGVIQNSMTGQLAGLAPEYDAGRSLLWANIAIIDKQYASSYSASSRIFGRGISGVRAVVSGGLCQVERIASGIERVLDGKAKILSSLNETFDALAQYGGVRTQKDRAKLVWLFVEKNCREIMNVLALGASSSRELDLF
jgi:hypothetical protein